MTTSYRYIVYEEPDTNCETGSIRITLTVDEAIALQKNAAKTKGYVYDSDEKALADFMTIHWAWKLEDETYAS